MSYHFVAALIVISLSAVAALAAGESPYVGQEKRAIKALSEQEIADYLNGAGMGSSKAAELNHYPGPRHVLDAAQVLALTPEQRKTTQAVVDAMRSRATGLGEQIVAKEAELDKLFASSSADANEMRRLVTDLAALQAEFRLAHLSAHLAMRDVLSTEQIAKYDMLRGYGGAASGEHKHQH
jgi:Spy/CpxP family protein refolding chaperone